MSSTDLAALESACSSQGGTTSSACSDNDRLGVCSMTEAGLSASISYYAGRRHRRLDRPAVLQPPGAARGRPAEAPPPRAETGTTVSGVAAAVDTCYIASLDAMGRTVIVGDVHGLPGRARRPARSAWPSATAIRLVFVGDLVVRGPNPRAVVDLAIRHGARSVRGNHEDRLLRSRADPTRRMSQATAATAAVLGPRALVVPGGAAPSGSISPSTACAWCTRVSAPASRSNGRRRGTLMYVRCLGPSGEPDEQRGDAALGRPLPRGAPRRLRPQRRGRPAESTPAATGLDTRRGLRRPPDRDGAGRGRRPASSARPSASPPSSPVPARRAVRRAMTGRRSTVPGVAGSKARSFNVATSVSQPPGQAPLGAGPKDATRIYRSACGWFPPHRRTGASLFFVVRSFCAPRRRRARADLWARRRARVQKAALPAAPSRSSSLTRRAVNASPAPVVSRTSSGSGARSTSPKLPPARAAAGAFRDHQDRVRAHARAEVRGREPHRDEVVPRCP